MPCLGIIFIHNSQDETQKLVRTREGYIQFQKSAYAELDGIEQRQAQWARACWGSQRGSDDAWAPAMWHYWDGGSWCRCLPLINWNRTSHENGRRRHGDSTCWIKSSRLGRPSHWRRRRDSFWSLKLSWAWGGCRRCWSRRSQREGKRRSWRNARSQWSHWR